MAMEMEQVSIGIPHYVAEEFREIATERGLSFAAAVRAVLMQYVDHRSDGDTDTESSPFGDPFSRPDLHVKKRFIRSVPRRTNRRRMDKATRERLYGDNQFRWDWLDDD